MPNSATHVGEPDTINPEYEKSWKSTTARSDVPIDISDLHEKLTKLTSQRVAGQASSQAVTPGDVGPQGGQMEGQLIDGQGRTQQQSPHVQQPSTSLQSQSQTQQQVQLQDAPSGVSSDSSQTTPAAQSQGVPMMNPYMHGAQQMLQYQGMMPHYQGLYYPPYYASTDPMLQMQMHQQMMQQYIMMNQMQQQPQSSQQANPLPPQYLIPQGWMYQGQMPMYTTAAMGSQQSQGVAPAQGHVPETGVLGQIVSPPRSPGQSRKAMSEDGSSDGSIHSTDGQSRKGDLANLEQALIKKLHGNRKDVQQTSTAHTMPIMTMSATGGQIEGGNVHMTDEMLQTDLSPPNGDAGGFVNNDVCVHSDGNETNEDLSSTNEIRTSVKRRSRFTVEAVSEDKIAVDQTSSDTDISASCSGETLDQSDRSNLQENVPNITSRKGRFSVTTVKDSVTIGPSQSLDEEDGHLVEVMTTNTPDTVSIPSQTTNKTDEGSQGAGMLKATGVSRFLQRLHDSDTSYNSVGASNSHLYKMARAASLDSQELYRNATAKKKRSISLGQLPPPHPFSEDGAGSCMGLGSVSLQSSLIAAHAPRNKLIIPADSVDTGTQTSPMVVKTVPRLSKMGPRRKKVRQYKQ